MNIHSTLPCLLMLSTIAAADSDPRWLTYPGNEEIAPGNGRRVVLVSGDEEYRSEEGLPMLARLLSAHGYEAVVLFSQDPGTGEIGVAVQSKFIAVGAVVPWAKAGVGAVATQSFANLSYGPRGLKLLKEGKSPAEAIALLTADDP